MTSLGHHKKTIIGFISFLVIENSSSFVYFSVHFLRNCIFIDCKFSEMFFVYAAGYHLGKNQSKNKLQNFVKVIICGSSLIYEDFTFCKTTKKLFTVP